MESLGLKEETEKPRNLELIFLEKTGKNFNAFYSKYYKKLVWQIQKLNINILDAEGIANDAFMHSLEKIDQYNPEYHYSTWLFTIGRNKAYEYKNLNAKTILVDTNNEGNDNDTFNTFQYYLNTKIDNLSKNIDNEKMLSFKYNETLKQIATLDPKYKIIIELSDIHGKSYNEIIDILGNELHLDPDQRLQTVKNRLHHGRSKIEKQLKSKFQYIMNNY